MTKSVGSHIAQSQINTLCCQQKQLEHKGGQSIICTSKGQSGDEAMSSSEEIKPATISIVESYTWLKASVSVVS